MLASCRVSVVLLVWDSTTAAGGGTPVRNPYGLDVNTYASVVDLKTPEGYAVYFDESGETDAVYLRITSSHWEKSTKDGDEPGDWSEEVRFDPDFLKNKQETYDGRKATSLDPDFDGVTTAAENACGDMNPLDNDTDNDGMRAAKRTQRAGASPAFAVARTAM